MDGSDLCYLSAVEQKELLDAGAVSCVELVEHQIERIERINPEINAFVTLCLDAARAEAQRKDSERASGDAHGALHGLTVGVKDCFATSGVRTTYGSVALADHVPTYDHLVVERERKAGAIILGKLNTPEFTMARAVCGNDVFGETRNPWNTDLCPGSSSGGSGAALASGLCSLADGSDIGGSVRNPAAWCNIVGHRPSSWVIPDVPNPLYWHNMNTPGPMARTVRDAALFLSVLAGPDHRCPVRVPLPFDHRGIDLRDDLAGLRIGWASDHGSIAMDPDVDAGFQAQISVFADLGAEVERHDIDLVGVEEAANLLCNQRLAREIEPFLSDGVDRSLIRRRTQFHNQPVAAIDRAEGRRHRLWNSIVTSFEQFDVLVWPDDARDAYGFDDTDSGDSTDWTLLTVSPLLGLPTTTVPCGFSESGIPRGLQIIGPPGADHLTLSVAHAFEQQTGFHQRRAVP